MSSPPPASQGETLLTFAGTRINVCDLPERYEQLQEYCQGTLRLVRSGSAPVALALGRRTENLTRPLPSPGKSKLVPLRDGHLVSRESDFIIYSVEAAYLDRVVAQYGPCERPTPNLALAPYARTDNSLILQRQRLAPSYLVRPRSRRRSDRHLSDTCPATSTSSLYTRCTDLQYRPMGRHW